MLWGNIDLSLLIASLMAASVPIILAALGELVVERSGVLNLGVEGMMIMGAVCGFIAAVETQSLLWGFIAGAAGGAALSLMFIILTQFFLANHVASGLALTLMGLGISSLIGQDYVGVKPPQLEAVAMRGWADISFWGNVLFSHDAMVYFSFLAVVAVHWWLSSTRSGLILRAVGENHTAAHALGYKVVLIRSLACLFGGAMAGLGGAYISLARVPQWTDGITAGIGWIALAIVVFASWRVWRVLLGAYLFGGVAVLQFNLQAAGIRIPVEYLASAPYIATILALVFMSSARNKAALSAPACLGKSFHASH